MLPTLWFYNRWWDQEQKAIPEISYINKTCVKATHKRLDNYYFYFQRPTDALFTDNETNTMKVSNVPNEIYFYQRCFS